jgi:hypothetical protein
VNLDYVIRLLHKRLRAEQAFLQLHSRYALHHRKYAESARMAAARIPQLQQAIHILQKHHVDNPPNPHADPTP